MSEVCQTYIRINNNIEIYIYILNDAWKNKRSLL